MAKVTIEPAAWVLVCDGRRALFLQNTADRERPNLVVRHQKEAGGHSFFTASCACCRSLSSGVVSSSVLSWTWRSYTVS